MGRGRLAADQANAYRRTACLVFLDESGLSLTPNVRSTWAPRGQPPTLVHPFNWKRASMAAALCCGGGGGGAEPALHVQAGNYNTATLIGVLGELRCFLGGQKVTLLWDGLPPTAASRCKRLSPASGTGWWSSAYPPTHPTSTR